MNFLGNDPTGTYQGKWQGPHGKHWKRKAVKRSRKPFRSKAMRRALANLKRHSARQEKDSPAVYKPLHLSQVPTKPSRLGHLMARVSDDFWSRVRPKDLSRAEPQDEGMGSGRRDSASATHKSGGTNPREGMTKGPTPGGEGPNDTAALRGYPIVTDGCPS